MSKESPLPSGKIPPTLLQSILKAAPHKDERVVIGPAIGMDCAVIDFEGRYLVVKSDPITFTTEEMGWYLVQINANDIATTGAVPKWLMLTLLLPEKTTYSEDVIAISDQVFKACEQLNISVIGGHTEITGAVSRPIAIGTMLGEVSPNQLITPEMASPGDKILLTKGIPLEAVGILAHEFHEEIVQRFGNQLAQEAREYLYHPGIGVSQDAQIACRAGRVTAMHDPTEGGIAGGLWELAQASGLSIEIDLDKIQIPRLASRISEMFNINPYAAISSGAMLIGVVPEDADNVCGELQKANIDCTCIGTFDEGPPAVHTNSADNDKLISLPARDEIARLFEERLT